MPQLDYIGTSPTKSDAVVKAVGDTIYGDDFRLPGELYGKVVRAEITPARIKKIDVKKALSIPGVHCVLTAKDIPGQNAGRYPDFPLLANEIVLDIGDPIALIAAENRDLAEEAAKSIKITYEKLSGSYDFRDLKNAEIVCDWKTLKSPNNSQKFDIDKIIQNADVVIENTYTSSCVDHAFIEPEGGMAWVDESGLVNIRVPTQGIENYKNVASVLGLPASKVRYDCPMLGGAFGGKEHPQLGAFLALLSIETGRPVRMAYTREETINSGSKKHPFEMKYISAANKDGMLVAIDVDIIGDAGAYVTNSKGLLLGALVVSGGPYNYPYARGRARAILTNNPFTEAMRGVGANQVCFAYESQMDELAIKLKIDPTEFRLKNTIKKGETLMQNQPVPGRVMLPELFESVAKKVGKRKNNKKESRVSSPWVKGFGIIGNIGGYGRPLNAGDAFLSIDDDGSVQLRAGASDVGAGQTQTYCQIASEALGIPLSDISPILSDSHITPLAGITAGSRQTMVSGGATFDAGMQLRGRLLEVASELLEVSKEDLNIRDSIISVISSPKKSVKLTEVIKKCKEENVPLHATGNVKFGKHEYEGNEIYGAGGGWLDYVFGVHAAEVKVNKETGEVIVLNYWSGHDVGQAINSQHVEGQFEGGTMMGIGHGLMEEILVKDGKVLTEHFESYLIPTASETPEWENVILESGEGLGPYGAKGIGEPPCTAGAAAVACAVSDAIGKRIKQIPVTPGHVLEVLGKIK